MSKLVLKRFRCLEETDEDGDDSPHFLLFHGRRGPSGNASSHVTLVRRSSWDDAVAQNDLIQPNMTVLDPFADHLVIAALVEEDYDPDFTGQQMTRLRGWICPFFNSVANSVSTGIDGTIAQLVRQEFERGVRSLRSNDDLVRVRVVYTEGAGLGAQPMKFNGDGGRYDVRWAIE